MRHVTLIAAALLAVPPVAAGQQATPGDLFIRHRLTLDARTETGAQLHGAPDPNPSLRVIDSIRPLDAGRRIFTRTLQFDVDARGTATNSVPLSLFPGARDTASLGRLEQGQLVLPCDAGADFPEHGLAGMFRVLPRSLRTGTPVTETSTWRTERRGVRGAELGTRVTTFLRDTVVDGRTFWVMRDSASVEREDAWPVQSFGAGEGMGNVWRATGVRTGVWLYDPERALTRYRADTLRLDGDLTRTESSGRTIGTRRQVVRVDTWTVFTPPEYARLSAERMAEARRTSGGMVPTPGTPLQQRLMASDTAALDSLVRAWQGSDAAARRAIELELAQWWRRAPDVHRHRLFAAALEIGDTLAAFRQATSNMGSYPQRSLPRAELLFMLPYLEDPARALRIGISVEAAFDGILSSLMSRPLVLYGDSASTCGKGACAPFERYIDRTDVDPRLRDLGVIAAFYRDPRAGFALMDARAATGTALLRRVHRQAQGYAFEWNQPGRGSPVPPPAADWNAWAAWAGGRVGDFFAPFDALRLYQLRTGRDFAREFRTGYERAQSDSARYTFGMLLRGVAPDAFTDDEVIALLESGNQQLAALGRSALSRITALAVPAATEVAEPLLDALIDMIFDGAAPPWAGGNASTLTGHRAPDAAVMLITDSLPTAVRARWQERITLVSDADWQKRDPRAAATAYLLRVRQAGSFVVLTYTHTDRFGVEPDAAPRHYAGGGEIVLVRTATGWKQLSHTAWVT